MALVEDSHSDEPLRAGDLEVWPERLLARARGSALPLSLRELTLLTALIRRPDRVISREELYREVWGRTLRKHDRSIDVYVRKLRTKLAKALPQTRFIHTHVGLGYRFSVEQQAARNNTTTTKGR